MNLSYQTFKPLIVFGSFLFFVLAHFGCQSEEDKKLIKDSNAANERIRVLSQNNSTLQTENERLKESKEGETKQLTIYYEERLSSLKKSHKEIISELDLKIANLSRDFGNSQRLLLASQQLLDQPEYIAGIQKQNFTIERTVWTIIVFINVVVAVHFAFKYFSVRTKIRDDFVRGISELTKYEGENL